MSNTHLPDALVELLEWRGHGSHDFIAYTEFGPYLVDAAYERPRAWLPDEAQQGRIMVEGFTNVEAAKAFCQQDLDGRRALKMIKDFGHDLPVLAAAIAHYEAWSEAQNERPDDAQF